jgi:hypothetical protein
VGIGRGHVRETEERGLAGTHGQNDPLLATTKEIGPEATPRAADVLKTTKLIACSNFLHVICMTGQNNHILLLFLYSCDVH